MYSANTTVFPRMVSLIVQPNVFSDPSIEESAFRSLLQLVKLFFLEKIWNVPLFWWPKMKHDLALAREVISCRRSKLQDWVDITTPRFWSKKEFRSTGTLGACKAVQKDLKCPPHRCCLHFYRKGRLATCLLPLICKRYSSVSFISQGTNLPKALLVTGAGQF